MSAEVTCPNCDWTLVVEPDGGNRHVTCWNCEHEFVLLAAAGSDLPADEPPADPPPADVPPVARSARPVGAWVVAAVAVVAVGAAGAVAWVSARRAVEAERAVEQVRAERDAAEQAARTAAGQLQAARQDAEAARKEVAARDRSAATSQAEVARAAAPAEEPGAIPRDIPADVRAAATARLRKVAEVTVPLFRKALADNRAELARLRNPFRPVKFPTPAAKDAAIAACEKRIVAAEKAVKAWDKNDLAYFAPDLPTPATPGAVGRITGGQVRVARVLGRDAAVVEFPVSPVGQAKTTTAVVTGIDGGKLAGGRTAELADVVVVAGTVTVDDDTYPRLAVFSASNP